MSIKSSIVISKKFNSQLEDKQKKLGLLFARRVRVSEKKIIQEISSSLVKMQRLTTDEGILTYSNLLKKKIDRIIAKEYIKPFGFAGAKKFSTSKGSLVERALAESTLFSNKHAFKFISVLSQEKKVLYAAQKALLPSQAVLASRIAGFGKEYSASVANWIQSNIVEQMIGGSDSAAVASRAEALLSKGISPFRVRNITPESRFAVIGMASPKVAIKNTISSAVEESEFDFYAKSMAIHDGRAYPDSLEAEEITSNWVGYPEPYLSMTEFRRRPNDRCYDVIISAVEYRELMGDQQGYEERLANWQEEENQVED